MTLIKRLDDLAAAIRDKFNLIAPRLIPSGGETGQALVKTGADDFALGWAAITGGGGAGSAVDVQVFTTSGTWTPVREGAKLVEVHLVSGGGGGGAGRVGAGGTAIFGGGGGAGGYYNRRLLPFAATGGTLSVVVGAGGVGGAAQTISNSNGANGTAGGQTAVYAGSTILALARNFSGFGFGGTATNGLNGSSEVFSGILGQWVQGGHGGKAQVSSSPSGAGLSNGFAPTGGGAGGGFGTNQNTIAGGGGGNILTEYGKRIEGGVGGNGGGGHGGKGTDGSVYPNLMPGAGGGGGGGGGISIAGGNGGDGGICGGGGGGGGGALNGVSSGAGGRGGDGIAIIITFY